jgi:hypothetical protein
MCFTNSIYHVPCDHWHIAHTICLPAIPCEFPIGLFPSANLHDRCPRCAVLRSSLPEFRCMSCRVGSCAEIESRCRGVSRRAQSRQRVPGVGGAGRVRVLSPATNPLTRKQTSHPPTSSLRTSHPPIPTPLPTEQKLPSAPRVHTANTVTTACSTKAVTAWRYVCVLRISTPRRVRRGRRSVRSTTTSPFSRRVVENTVIVTGVI